MASGAGVGVACGSDVCPKADEVTRKRQAKEHKTRYNAREGKWRMVSPTDQVFVATREFLSLQLRPVRQSGRSAPTLKLWAKILLELVQKAKSRKTSKINGLTGLCLSCCDISRLAGSTGRKSIPDFGRRTEGQMDDSEVC